MPPLTNHRHELFAQGLAQGRSASEAYRNAGYRPNDGNACTLKGHQKISKRVEEIVQEDAAIHREGVAKAIEAKKSQSKAS
jgi:phage terminase small subunit